MRLLRSLTLTLLALGLAAPAARADVIVYPSGPTPYGNTNELSSKWWQYAFSVPIDKSPFFDPTGANAYFNNTGPVFFLAGQFALIPDASGAFHATAHRSITLPQGVPLYFPILNVEFDNIGTPAADLKTLAQLRQLNADNVASAQGLYLRIDGVSVPNLATQHRDTSPVPFDITFPDNNLYQFFGVNVPAGFYGANDFAFPNGNAANGFRNSPTADGFYALLGPLPPGTHRIEFGGSFGPRGAPGSFALDIIYDVTVTPEPGTVVLWSCLLGGAAAWQWRRRATAPATA